jgi:predicted nucleotidyltransferase
VTRAQPPSHEAIVHAVREVLPRARAAWLFGSAAQGRFQASSDLDIAVDTVESLSALQRWEAGEQLARRFGHDVDLLDFRHLSTVMQAQVLSTGTLLFSVEPATTADYCAFVFSEYQNIQAWRQPMMRQLADRLSMGGCR